MEVLIRNAEGNLSEEHREYAVKKLERLDRFFHSANKVEIVHRQEKLNHRIEVTIHADGLHVRGEENDASVTAAIDRVAEKMENRLRRLKSRMARAHRHRGRAMASELELEEPPADDDVFAIHEEKRYLIKPLSLEEAALQMELLGRDFFVFLNEESNQTEVLYRRTRGVGYGLMLPEG